MDDAALCVADRRQAGRALAAELQRHRASGAVVLGLARGGVPGAYEVASELALALDVCVVRRIALPGREERAWGAVAHATPVLNPVVVHAGFVDAATAERDAAREAETLAGRERAYR